MGVLGPGNIGAWNLVGSFAGAQRNDADADRVKAESAAKTLQGDMRALSAGSLEDVAEAEMSADRDADGRLPDAEPQPPEEEPPEMTAEPPGPSSRRRADARGERGNALDLEA